MKVAIYSRYSTDMQDASSIAGQVANCEALALAKGWQVVERYKDQALSGGDDNRPGYKRLLADSEAGLFDGIIVDETSRLTRRAGELPRLLEILAFHRQFIVDCKGFDSRDQNAALLASIYGGIDSLELQKIKERTHRGLRERSKDGYSAGGKAYGYDTVPVDPNDPKSKKIFVINQDQAAILVEIFTRYANGESPQSIVTDLNQRGVPHPGADWNRKKPSKGWTHTTLVGSAKSFTGILRRELYVGQLVWNRRKWKKKPGTNKRIAEMNPASEWVITEQPDLRIIDDLLWKKTQSRLSESRRSTHSNNLRARSPRYLLSGLMTCGECGANIIMQDARSYGCSSHTNGRQHCCSNNLRIKREIAETVILRNIKAQLLGDEVGEFVADLFRNAVRELDAVDDAASIEDELAQIEYKIEKIVEAIETVGISDTLASRLRTLESSRDDAVARLEVANTDQSSLSALPDLIPDLMAHWREMVENIENFATNPDVRPGEIEVAREQLHALLGQITLKPKDGVLWAHPALNAKGLTEASPLHMSVVAGAGFEPATFGL